MKFHEWKYSIKLKLRNATAHATPPPGGSPPVASVTTDYYVVDQSTLPSSKNAPEKSGSFMSPICACSFVAKCPESMAQTTEVIALFSDFLHLCQCQECANEREGETERARISETNGNTFDPFFAPRHTFASIPSTWNANNNDYSSKCESICMHATLCRAKWKNLFDWSNSVRLGVSRFSFRISVVCFRNFRVEIFAFDWRNCGIVLRNPHDSIASCKLSCGS